MYLVGSKLLGLKNPSDEDYIDIVEDNKNYRKLIDGKDVNFRNKDLLIKIMNFEADFNQWALAMSWNYQLDADIIKQDFPIEYHILEHKEALQKFLNEIKNKRERNYHPNIYDKNKCMFKSCYHIAYNKFILENNSIILTPEQLDIVQKIHDHKMTWEEYLSRTTY